MTSTFRTRAKQEGQRGIALLAVIFLLMIASVSLLAVAPNAKVQAQREREIEAYYRGDQMAEAIARYYSGGKLNPNAGLVVKSPPPPYGFLTDLKKLRDGVTIGADQLYLVRKSAFIDPLTGQEWEPVRIGDPRLRRFFRAWQASTGRPLPPIYTQYMGGGNIVDTTPKPDGTGNTPDGQGSNGNGTQVQPGAGSPPDEQFGDDDDDDDTGDDDDDTGDDDDDDGGASKSGQSELIAPGNATFVNASYQIPDPGTTDDGQTGQPSQPGQPGYPGQPSQPGQPGQPGAFPRSNQQGSIFGGTKSAGPIIGVVTKAKGPAVRTRFGLTKYEDQIFIYFPPAPIGLPGPGQQPPQAQPGANGQASRPTDLDGDGIDDTLKPPPGAGGGGGDDDDDGN